MRPESFHMDDIRACIDGQFCEIAMFACDMMEDEPSSLPHFSYVIHSRLCGMSSTLPIRGRPFGPGGRGHVAFFLQA